MDVSTVDIENSASVQAKRMKRINIKGYLFI